MITSLSLSYIVGGLAIVVVMSVKQGCVSLFMFVSEKQEANSQLLYSQKYQLLLDWVSSYCIVCLSCKLSLLSHTNRFYGVGPHIEFSRIDIVVFFL